MRAVRSPAILRPASIPLLLVAILGCGGDDRPAGGGGGASGTISRIQGIGEQRGGTEDDINFLVERLRDGDPAERASAAWALGRASGPDQVQALMTAAREDVDRDVRLNAVTAVGNLGGPGAEETLVGFLVVNDDHIQAAALKALGNRRYLGAHAHVGKLLLEGKPVLRPLAADALASMQNPDSLPALQKGAEDPDKQVRVVVAFALGKIGDSGAVPALTSMLDDEAWEVRANAAQALGMIGDSAAEPALQALLEDSSRQVQIAAQKALAKL